MKINFSQEENLLKNLATTLCNTKGEQTVCMYFNSLCVMVIHDFMIDSVGSYFAIFELQLVNTEYVSTYNVLCTE